MGGKGFSKIDVTDSMNMKRDKYFKEFAFYGFGRAIAKDERVKRLFWVADKFGF